MRPPHCPCAPQDTDTGYRRDFRESDMSQVLLGVQEHRIHHWNQISGLPVGGKQLGHSRTWDKRHPHQRAPAEMYEAWKLPPSLITHLIFGYSCQWFHSLVASTRRARTHKLAHVNPELDRSKMDNQESGTVSLGLAVARDETRSSALIMSSQREILTSVA